MKFERCKDCGLMYDRHIRDGFCPHCQEDSWYRSMVVALSLLALAATALICWL